MADVPHFRFPFRFESTSEGIHAAESEQDSIEEVAEAVLFIVRTPRGWVPEDRRLGIEDPTFSAPVDYDSLRNNIVEQEPRADIEIDEEDPVDTGLSMAGIEVGV